MATLGRFGICLGAVLGLASGGCSKPSQFDEPLPTLAQVHVLVTGDLAAVEVPDPAGDAPQLHVALVWARQWQPEPFCIQTADSPEVAAVMAAGCPDSLRFVPNRVAADIPIQPGTPAAIDLITLPSADLMVGDLTGRIVYASLIVYDDRNGDGQLDLRHPPWSGHHHEDAPVDAPGAYDVVYGASFISMSMPDQRLAYMEGDFSKLANVAFYPRHNCPPPPQGFSLLSAGGFSLTDALASSRLGELPDEDPASCGTATLQETVVLPLQTPGSLNHLACSSHDDGGSTSYRQAPGDQNAPDFAHRPWACTGFPHLSGDTGPAPAGQQLVLAGKADDACQSVTHYTLRGCDNDPACPAPSWDLTTPPASPPAWWPCPLSP